MIFNDYLISVEWCITVLQVRCVKKACTFRFVTTKCMTVECGKMLIALKYLFSQSCRQPIYTDKTFINFLQNFTLNLNYCPG